MWVRCGGPAPAPLLYTPPVCLPSPHPSPQVASQALQAILPAWTGAGKSLQQLAEAVVAALPRISPHRRLPLLAALVSALPEVDGLCSVLALLLETAVAQQAAAAAGDACMAETDAAATEGGEAAPAWATDLAGDLMEQVCCSAAVVIGVAEAACFARLPCMFAGNGLASGEAGLHPCLHPCLHACRLHACMPAPPTTGARLMTNQPNCTSV